MVAIRDRLLGGHDPNTGIWTREGGILISKSFPEIVPSVLEKVVVLVNLYAEVSENP